GHPGPRVQEPRFRSEAGAAVRAGAGGDGGADRPVVAGRAPSEEGGGGRASGEPGVARPGRPGAEAAADRSSQELRGAGGQPAPSRNSSRLPTGSSEQKRRWPGRPSSQVTVAPWAANRAA